MFIGFIISAHRFLFNKKKITTKIENERGAKITLDFCPTLKN